MQMAVKNDAEVCSTSSILSVMDIRLYNDVNEGVADDDCTGGGESLFGFLLL